MYLTSLLGKMQTAGKVSTPQQGDTSVGYPAKVQLIVRPHNQQWYVNFPNALAQALALRKGETVEWEIESREVVVMVRREASPARRLKRATTARQA
jgi:hypothetical protein